MWAKSKEEKESKEGGRYTFFIIIQMFLVHSWSNPRMKNNWKIRFPNLDQVKYWRKHKKTNEGFIQFSLIYYLQTVSVRWTAIKIVIWSVPRIIFCTLQHFLSLLLEFSYSIFQIKEAEYILRSVCSIINAGLGSKSSIWWSINRWVTIIMNIKS